MILVAVIAPVLIIMQLNAHYRVDVVDDQMFGYFGWRIANGAVVYRDVWDNKPPGIYWINALGFVLGRDHYAGVIALCAAATIVSLASILVIASSIYYRGAAVLTTLLASFYLTHSYYQAGANRTETFLVAFELAAVALYFRGFVRDRWWVWLLVGLLCGCAFLFKQVGLAGWGAMGLHLGWLMVTRQLPVTTVLRRGLLMAVGPVVVVGIAAGVLAAQGVLDMAYHAVFTFNRAYFEQGASNLRNTFVNRYFLQQHMFPILRLPVLMSIAALIHGFLWWLRPLYRPPEIEQPMRALRPAVPHYLLLFCVWWAAAFYGAVLSPHYFRHYLVPTLPPMLLICGYLIHVLRTEISLILRFQQRIWVVAAFVLMGYLALDAYKLNWQELASVWLFRYGGDKFQQSEWEQVADVVARYSEPDDRVQCFGYQPGVYLHARRLNATRYTTTEKIGQLEKTVEAEQIRQHLIRELSAAPPELLVMSAGDYFAIYRPELLNKPQDSLGRFLAGFMREQYAVVADIRAVNVYVLKRRDLLNADTPEIPVNLPATGDASQSSVQ